MKHHINQLPPFSLKAELFGIPAEKKKQKKKQHMMLWYPHKVT